MVTYLNSFVGPSHTTQRLVLSGFSYGF